MNRIGRQTVYAMLVISEFAIVWQDARGAVRILTLFKRMLPKNLAALEM